MHACRSTLEDPTDSRKREHEALELYELGIDELLPVSALHGSGTGELEEAIARALPEIAEDAPGVAGTECPRIAIVGRPNAGKSSLVNRLLGEERHLVDARPGTTVDPIDSLYVRDGREMVLIDTAGIRRRRAVEKGVEGLAVVHAIRAMERAHAVVLMIDAEEGPAEQDARIAGLAEERGRAMVIALNKADRLDARATKKAIERTREIVAFAPWAPVIATSVKEGTGVEKLVRAVESALAEHDKRVGTAEVNRFFEEVLETHPPPTSGKRSVRLYYVTQAEVRPPTFVVVANRPDDVHFSYRRYVANQLRRRFGFEGTPLRVRYRAKRRREL